MNAHSLRPPAERLLPVLFTDQHPLHQLLPPVFQSCPLSGSRARWPRLSRGQPLPILFPAGRVRARVTQPATHCPLRPEPLMAVSPSSSRKSTLTYSQPLFLALRVWPGHRDRGKRQTPRVSPSPQTLPRESWQKNSLFVAFSDPPVHAQRLTQVHPRGPARPTTILLHKPAELPGSMCTPRAQQLRPCRSH